MTKILPTDWTITDANGKPIAADLTECTFGRRESAERIASKMGKLAMQVRDANITTAQALGAGL